MQEIVVSPLNAVVFEIMGYRAFYYPLVDVARSLGIAQQTAYNQAIAGTFPIRNYKLGGKRVVALADLADFVARGLEPASSLSTHPPAQAAETEQVKRRGRPMKVIRDQKNLRF